MAKAKAESAPKVARLTPTRIMKVADLKPADYNPRRMPEKEARKLKRSLQDGYMQGVIWNEKTGNVVGGHQRLNALVDLGYEEVEVHVISVSPAKERALNIALNRISGEWDDRKLRDVLHFIDKEDVKLLDETGMDREELLKHLGNDQPGGLIVEDEEPKQRNPTIQCPHCGGEFKLKNPEA